jgi:hypothetical protein
MATRATTTRRFFLSFFLSFFFAKLNHPEATLQDKGRGKLRDAG